MLLSGIGRIEAAMALISACVSDLFHRVHIGGTVYLQKGDEYLYLAVWDAASRRLCRYSRNLGSCDGSETCESKYCHNA